MMGMLDPLLSFTKLTNQLSATERFINLPCVRRRENVSEHCTQLALTAWYLVDRHELPLDRQKVLQYALIHDITEANTGDFPTHRKECDRDEKRRLERKSLDTLKTQHPEAFDLWFAYEVYEKRTDEESKFVYALDKLLPALNIYLGSCEEWKNRDSNELKWYFEDLMRRMSPSPIILAFWNELYNRARNEHPELENELS